MGADGKAWVPTKNHYLCSDHFLVTDYQVRPGVEKHYLRAETVPSVFPSHPRHLQVSKHLLVVEDVRKAMTCFGYLLLTLIV